MSLWVILGLALALAMDAFAVSIAVGVSLPELTRRHVFRLAWHFGLFQALMPILGWLAGQALADSIAGWDHWIAFGLLTAIGGKMIYESFVLEEHEKQARGDPTKGLTLITLSVATSLDALAVGLTMALLDVSVWLAAVIIGLVAGGLTVVGIRFGHRFGHHLERWAEVLGGLVLIAIGLNILLRHLF